MSVWEVGKNEMKEFVGGIKYPLMTLTIELEEGQGKLKRGAILGKVTSSNKFKLVDKNASDGSEAANCVLAHDIDTGVSTVAMCYVSGQFKLSQLYIKDDGDVLEYKEELRAGNIYIATEV